MMNVYLVKIKQTEWCQDYAMVVIAEDEKHAERKARWSSDDFLSACFSSSAITTIDVYKRQTGSK